LAKTQAGQSKDFVGIEDNATRAYDAKRVGVGLRVGIEKRWVPTKEEDSTDGFHG